MFQTFQKVHMCTCGTNSNSSNLTKYQPDKLVESYVDGSKISQVTTQSAECSFHGSKSNKTSYLDGNGKTLLISNDIN